ncbi:hypothetical protein J6590_015638 [Homalodisca vitripennis]|nr:hypothetical protein J6590_015638 [Homalodisca vitripennis]
MGKPLVALSPNRTYVLLPERQDNHEGDTALDLEAQKLSYRSGDEQWLEVGIIHPSTPLIFGSMKHESKKAKTQDWTGRGLMRVKRL